MSRDREGLPPDLAHAEYGLVFLRVIAAYKSPKAVLPSAHNHFLCGQACDDEKYCLGRLEFRGERVVEGTRVFEWMCRGCKAEAANRHYLALTQQKYLGDGNSRIQVDAASFENSYYSREKIWELLYINPPGEPVYRMVEKTSGLNTYSTLVELTQEEKYWYFARAYGISR